MAKVTITFSDTDDGRIDVSVEFAPPAKEGESTPAQRVVANLLGHLEEETKDGGIQVTETRWLGTGEHGTGSRIGGLVDGP